ncbi:MAG: type I restriction enzyme HsdR N-terminal domain-containing protein [Bacteroidia bacterium]|nr:type I restriction enzyme HsdR N-terminal domain-containing protein [Bacteroidia bacterium]
MQPLNLPTYSFNIKSRGERRWIFDVFRGRWCLLTPEEWVRQNFARYLCEALGYPESLVLLEQKITHHSLSRRCDIVAYNRLGQPIVLVECKAPEIVLNQKAFNQIARYNMVLGVNILLITNGLDHYCIQIHPQTATYSFLKDIPSFRSIADQSSTVI